MPKENWMDGQNKLDFIPPFPKETSIFCPNSEELHHSLAFSAPFETKVAAHSLDTDYIATTSINASVQQVHASGNHYSEQENNNNNDIFVPDYSQFSNTFASNDYPRALFHDPDFEPVPSFRHLPESISNLSSPALQFPQLGHPSYKDNSSDFPIKVNEMFYKLHLKYASKEKLWDSSMDLKVQIKLNSVEANCFLIVPLIRNLTPRIYGGFLADIMSVISEHISLEDFYDLLHHSAESHSMRFTSDNISKSVFSVEGKSDAFKICSFIVHMFKQANEGLGLKSGEDGQTNHPRAVVQYDEFLRNFLSIKILLDFIIEVGPAFKNESYIPRISVHKVYCQICQDLSKRSKQVWQPSKFHTNTAIGVSQFGIITKIVYPNLRVRRLGSRGKSRPHYHGFTWNTRLVDDDLIQRAELNTNQTCVSFTETSLPEAGKDNNECLANGLEESEPRIDSGNHSSIQKIISDTSSYSFVTKLSKLPKVNCSLRVFATTNKVPQQSDWSLMTMLKAVNFLQMYNLDLIPIVQDFQQNILSPLTPNTFYTQFVDRMTTLITDNSDIEGYKSLYLIVLLLLFPFVLSSDEEIRPDVKAHFRQNLTNFVNHSKLELFQKQNFESNHFINFLNIIKKMIRINEILSLQVSNTLIKSITKEISSILQESMIADSGAVERHLIEETILQAVFMAHKAFESQFLDSFRDESEKMTFITNVTAAFAKFCYSISELIIGILESASLQDSEGRSSNFPFYMFHKASQRFHELCLSDSYLSQLPIQMISFIFRQLNKEIQQGSLRHFSRKNTAVSSETFKTWWIHTTISEEYMQILAETIALSEIVAYN